MMSIQLTLGEGFEKYAKTTNRTEFLNDMDRSISMAGRIEQAKGFAALFEALAEDDLRALELRIGEHGSDFERLRERHERRGIVFLGRLDHLEVVAELLACDLAVVPSIWEESCAITMLEAMPSACRCWLYEGAARQNLSNTPQPPNSSARSAIPRSWRAHSPPPACRSRVGRSLRWLASMRACRRSWPPVRKPINRAPPQEILDRHRHLAQRRDAARDDGLVGLTELLRLRMESHWRRVLCSASRSY